MTHTIASTVRVYARQTYGPVMWRRLGLAVVAVPRALRTVASRRFGSGLLALPVAVAGTALTAVLAGLMLINVGYPLRSVLGWGGNDGGGVWAGTYDGSWGGPTLAGAWAVHGIGLMLLVFPPLAWAIRGLVHVQDALTGAARASSPAGAVVVAGPSTVARRPGGPARGSAGSARRRVGVIAAALASVYGLALLAHAAGIGDNVLWLPRDLRSGLALAIVLTPIAMTLTTQTNPKRP